MTTLKEHQAEMVKLLATGSGIPASASRLAHAMHDVLGVVMSQVKEDLAQQSLDFAAQWHEKHARTISALLNDATTPSLNEKALSKPTEPIKTDSPAKWPLKAEQRIKQLNNTIQQLRDSNAKLREELADKNRLLGEAVCSIAESKSDGAHWYERCLNAGLLDEDWVETPEQAGCRKQDTQVCGHSSWEDKGHGVKICCDCGADLAKDFRTKEAEAIALGKELGGY